MKNKNLFLMLIILILIFIPLISAYGGYYWGYFSPSEMLDNEWVLFSAIFLIFFAIIYYTINRTFQNNAVSAIIAIGISLLIALAIARRGLLYGYFGDKIGAWLLIIAILIGISLGLKFVHEHFGSIGTIVTVIGLWILLYNIDPYEILPYDILTENFIMIFEFITSWIGLIALIISIIIILSIQEGLHRREEETYFGFIPRRIRRRR